MIGKKIINYFKRIFEKFLQAEEQRINLCLPIAFALGIVFYFLLPFEPKLWLFLILFTLSIFGFVYLRHKNNLALLFLFTLFFFAGVCRIIVQTNWAQAPFIHKRYQSVSVEGSVEKVELRHFGFRLTLTDLKLDKIPKEEMPGRIRVSFNGQKVIPSVGDTVSLKATLSPPMLPFYPNDHNFARSAYYEKVGAVGYAVSKLKILSAKEKNLLQGIRSSILKRIKDILPENTSNIVAALVIGEQGGISKNIRDNYTSAGIVHILSVSGFHMGLIAGLIFAILRSLFCLFPSVCLRFNTKKVCAVLALILTLLYLLISGMAIPAIRSFLMIAFILIAIIADRTAISMRSVMWAGFLILLFQPQAITSVSFALSFGAVTALVAGYETFMPYLKKFCTVHNNFWIKSILGTVCFFLLMNIIAHLATAPFAIQHFHRYNTYAILGNLFISILFSFLIMPLLLVAIILMPFGLDKNFFLAVGYCLDKINDLTSWIANLPNATIFLPAFPTWGYALIVLGGLWLCIWQSRIRCCGFLVILIGLLSIFTHTPPDIIIGQGGKLIAIRQGDTFAFNTLRKQKSTRLAWLESNGISPDILPPKINDVDLSNIKGLKINLDGENKNDFDIVINSSGKCQARQLCLPRKKLWQEGVHAIYIKKNSIKIETAADGTFNRPWGQGQFKKVNQIYP